MPSSDGSALQIQTHVGGPILPSGAPTVLIGG